MARTGRPKVSDDPRMKKITLRVSNEEMARYEAYAEKHNLTKAEVLRKGFEKLLEEVKKLNDTFGLTPTLYTLLIPQG